MGNEPHPEPGVLMTGFSSRIIAAAVALPLAAMAFAPTPAHAEWRGGYGGYHGGYGGYHGGYGGYRGGYGGYRGGYGRGFGYGGAIVGGALLGLGVGALLSTPYYAPPPVVYAPPPAYYPQPYGYYAPPAYAPAPYAAYPYAPPPGYYGGG